MNRTPALFVEDAQYILEPVAKQLLAAGVSRRRTQTALRAAARRILRLAAQDAGLPMGVAQKHAGSVALTLVG